MAPNLKLIYFDLKGIAEFPRLIFHYGNIEFQDVRVTSREDFLKLKPTLPFGQVPILEVDGLLLCQSLAIARYAASLANLYPEDKLLAAKADMAVETIKEIFYAAYPVMYKLKDEDEKALVKTKFLSEAAPKFLSGLEKQVQGQYFLGDTISYADIGIYDILSSHLIPNFEELDLSLYPKLKAIQERIGASPEIKAYIKTQQPPAP